MEDKTQAKRRTLKGTVVSAKMAKTAVVRVDRKKVDSKYHKQYKVSSRYKVHDEKGECREGAIVEFEETRPISRDKRWRLVRITKNA